MNTNPKINKGFNFLRKEQCRDKLRLKDIFSGVNARRYKCSVLQTYGLEDTKKKILLFLIQALKTIFIVGTIVGLCFLIRRVRKSDNFWKFTFLICFIFTITFIECFATDLFTKVHAGIAIALGIRILKQMKN